jgi:hypothetical protein
MSKDKYIGESIENRLNDGKVTKDISEMTLEDKNIKLKEMYKKAIGKIGDRYEPYPECWDYLEEKYPTQFQTEKDLDNKQNDACNKWRFENGTFEGFRNALKEWYMFWMEYLKLYRKIKNDGRRT